VRFRYRLSQFWRTLFAKIDQPELEQALVGLSQSQKALFMRMQPGEQNHALIVYRRLLEMGENQPDLLVAALLHDAGKLRYRINPLERSMVVLVKAVLPKKALLWGELPSINWDSLPAWRKAFIVAEQHPEWGAELARKAGVSVLTENLIRQHDQPYSQGPDSEETSLLHKLWLVDNDS
jgi:hypothetical protein